MERIRRKYRPSSLEALRDCPCFRNRSFSGEAAAEGTMIHKVLESNTLPADLTDEQMEVVQYCRTERDALLMSWARAGSPMVEYREMWLDDGNMLSGTADVVALAETEGLLVDYKAGRLSVDEADNNVQGMAYSYLLFCEHPELTRIQLVFLQPRCEPQRTSRTYERHEFEDMKAKLYAIIERAEDPFKQPLLNPPVCGRCDLQTRCPKFANATLQVARSIGLPLPSEFAPDKLVSPKDRAIAQLLADALAGEDGWADLIKKANKEFVQAGGVIPGFKMQTRSGGVAIKDTAAAVNILIAERGMEMEQILPKLKVSITNLVDAICTARPDKEEAAVKKDLNNILIGVLETRPPVSFLRKEKKELKELFGGDTQKLIG